MDKPHKIGKKVEYYKCQECSRTWKNPPGKVESCRCGSEDIKNFQEDEK